MRIIALIPARGGSKGIKRKNLRKLGDSTLVGFKVKQALKTNCNEVWVSSDDVEILNEAKKNGAQTIERPSTLAEDDTSTDSVILHAIKLLNLDSDDILVLLQPTSPLIQTESINLCISKLINNTQLSSVISVRESHPFMWSPSDSGNWDPKLHSRNKRLRRQEISEEGQETGGCYAMRIGETLSQLVRYPFPTSVVKVGYLEALDIDTLDDLETATRIMNMNPQSFV